MLTANKHVLNIGFERSHSKPLILFFGSMNHRITNPSVPQNLVPVDPCLSELSNLVIRYGNAIIEILFQPKAFSMDLGFGPCHYSVPEKRRPCTSRIYFEHLTKRMIGVSY